LQSRGGTVAMRFGADGVACEITVPLPDQARPSTRGDATAAGIAAAPALLQQQSGAPALAGKRIILIEDEPLVAMEVESSLAEAGCDVVGSAGTMENARALVAAAQCDAALLDVNLAGHAVDELAATLTQRAIPFAFVTGYSRENLPQGFRDALVLRKPFSEAQLLAMIEVLLYQPARVVPFRPKKEAM
jgi:CheY-like chemotaxis protein